MLELLVYIKANELQTTRLLQLRLINFERDYNLTLKTDLLCRLSESQRPDFLSTFISQPGWRRLSNACWRFRLSERLAKKKYHKFIYLSQWYRSHLKDYQLLLNIHLLQKHESLYFLGQDWQKSKFLSWREHKCFLWFIHFRQSSSTHNDMLRWYLRRWLTNSHLRLWYFDQNHSNFWSENPKLNQQGEGEGVGINNRKIRVKTPY